MSRLHAVVGLTAILCLAVGGCKKPQPPEVQPVASGTPVAKTTGATSGPGAGLAAAKIEGQGPIKLGAYFGLTGNFATFGISSSNALRLAVDEINTAGGIGGQQIELTVEDDQCKPDEAASAASKLIDQDQVLVLIGEVASSNSLAAAPICQAAKVPMVTPTSTNPKVTKTGDYIFRACFTDDFQGWVPAKFAVDTLKARTAAVFSDVNSDYSQGLTEYFTAAFQKLGGKVVVKQSYSQGDKDFAAQLTAMAKAAPDVLYIPGYYNDVGPICQQARRLGLKSKVLGGDGFDSPKLVELGGDAVEGVYFSNHYSKDDPRPEVQSFLKAYQAKYNEVPDALAACAYDTVYLVAQAIVRAGKLDRAAVRDALAQTKDFPGVTGTITMDANRNAQKPAVILTIEKGQQKFVASVPPTGFTPAL